MPQPWIQHYPETTSSDIDITSIKSLLQMFHESVNQYGDKVAYYNYGASLSFNELDRLSADFAAYLQHETGLKKGQRVALMCPNTLSFVVAMWGIIRAGGAQVNVNPLYSPHELQHQLVDADVETIVIFAASTPTLAQIIDKTAIKNVIVIQLDDLINKNLPATEVDTGIGSFILFKDALERGKKHSLEEPELCRDDLLYLQYTGGTTGLSKGAMLSHGNLIANIKQYEELAKNDINYGNDIILTAIPMYHIFALSMNTLAYFSFGASNVLVTNPRDMKSFVETWSHYDITMFTGVNTLFNGLLHTPGFAEIDFSTLKMTIGGGAPVQSAVSDKWKEVTGKALMEGYGLSETSPVLTLNLNYVEPSISGIGIPVPSTEISLRDDEGKEVAPGDAGELCAKGPQVMAGYWNNDEATKDAMTTDGFFKTGDIAVLDEQGHFHIVDRKKDMILVSGFNVYPNEIEAEAAGMDDVMECACVGVPDEKTGEAVKLFVVKTNPSLTEQDIQNYCRSRLAAYKIPKQVIFIEELPKSTVGKILRRELR